MLQLCDKVDVGSGYSIKTWTIHKQKTASRMPLAQRSCLHLLNLMRCSHPHDNLDAYADEVDHLNQHTLVDMMK